MSANPLNLFLRFLLELAALIAAGAWGWQLTNSWLRFLLVIGIPAILAAIWAIFAVPDDPSRSGAAPVVTPGALRLLLELGIFAFATWCLYDIEYTRASIILGTIVLLHYAISYDRLLWLFSR